MSSRSRIRVLIVDDNAETQRGTRSLLEIYDEEIEVVDIASNPLEAIEMARSASPQVILMDINMPETGGIRDGLDATEHITREMPAIQVVIVSVQDDPNYMREALRAGASDFISKGYTAGELYRAVIDAHERWMQEAERVAPAPRPGPAPGPEAPTTARPGGVITVHGPKGGVGSTTVATSLAVGLARMDRNSRVVLFDNNVYYGDVGAFLAVRGRHNIVDATRVVRDEDVDLDYVETLLESHESGLRVLLGPDTPGDAHEIDGQDIRATIDVLRRLFDYVVVDTCSAFNSSTVASLMASDRVLLVATPDFPAIKNARIFLNVLAQDEYPMDRIQIVLNRMDRRYGITAQQVQDHLRIPVVAQIEDDPGAARRSVNDSIPLISGDPRRVAAVRGLRELVQFVIQDSQRTRQEDDDESDQRSARLFH
jgi:pilus assembly protein CpaE